jgi:hypothetical protein
MRKIDTPHTQRQGVSIYFSPKRRKERHFPRAFPEKGWRERKNSSHLYLNANI